MGIVAGRSRSRAAATRVDCCRKRNALTTKSMRPSVRGANLRPPLRMRSWLPSTRATRRARRQRATGRRGGLRQELIGAAGKARHKSPPRGALREAATRIHAPNKGGPSCNTLRKQPGYAFGPSSAASRSTLVAGRRASTSHWFASMVATACLTPLASLASLVFL